MAVLTGFADENNSQNEFWDDVGNPTIHCFGNGLQVWSLLQDRPTTVNEAALTFNATPECVRAAVEAHPWMYLDGDNIEHDGE